MSLLVAVLIGVYVGIGYNIGRSMTRGWGRGWFRLYLLVVFAWPLLGVVWLAGYARPLLHRRNAVCDVCAETTGQVERVKAVVAHARKISPAERALMYVADVEAALGQDAPRPHKTGSRDSEGKPQ